MLIDQVRKYYDKSYDLNCAETMLYAANEEYGLNLCKEALKTMAAFGGGMAVESVCGAVTGALAVIGVVFTKERAHESDRVKLLTSEFMGRYIKTLGTDNCRELKNRYRDDDTRCIKMVEIAAEILDDMVKREKSKDIV